MEDISYGFGRTLTGNIDEIRPRVEEALKQQGFGVLTEIDVSATLKKKLDQDFRPYLILGACNPSLASRALAEEPMIGLLLPCNVVLEEPSPGKVRVAVIDPSAMFQMIDSDHIAPVAAEADASLRRMLAALG